MLIIHENLQEEAGKISEACKEVFGIKSECRSENLENLFGPMASVQGYHEASAADAFVEGKGIGIRAFLNIKEKHVLVVTYRDLYFENNPDCWIFGCTGLGITTVSTSRVKRYDSNPNAKLEVPKELYLRRLSSIAVHEIGHIVVDGNQRHFQQAVWEESSGKQELGPHCSNNACVMYQIGEIRAPPPEKGFMWVGAEKRYDAGLDDVIERMGTNWFCNECKSSIRVEADF